MHPFHKFASRAGRALFGCGEFPGWHACRPGRPFWGSAEGPDEGGGGGFGVRRPLRFLAHKLDLDERQVAALARILDELKIERAQAEVDHRRTLALFADALGGETFDAAKANESGDLRLHSATRLREAVLKALREIHALLNADQRVRLSYLIRTGALVV